MKYFLLLSFILALLPGNHAAREHLAAKTKNFIPVADIVSSLPPSEHAKTVDTESEDLHPSDSNRPDALRIGEVSLFEYCFYLQSLAFSHYSIRAPPII